MILTSIGSILYALRRLSTKIATGPHKYNLDRDMMQKIYSMDKDKSKVSVVPERGSFSKMRQEQSKELLIDALGNRENFQYDVKKHFCARFCLCCCCCCWKSSLEERLFMKGQYKLHNEIDILKIIKKLRVAALTSQALLKPHQAMLVQWFDRYKVSLTQAERQNERIRNENDF